MLLPFTNCIKLLIILPSHLVTIIWCFLQPAESEQKVLVCFVFVVLLVWYRMFWFPTSFYKGTLHAHIRTPSYHHQFTIFILIASSPSKTDNLVGSRVTSPANWCLECGIETAEMITFDVCLVPNQGYSFAADFNQRSLFELLRI